ncbi:hypothetical protein C5167_046999 [Papaver somniferum]|uniref:LIM zinc-binding domain-containing protein n=1 Tax=Papaver somniferum TaxID=3469 RepID=A0A4Y7LHU2_PAPSO|nr:hypothetical protein C5167_046999 [Papaver somniferum]
MASSRIDSLSEPTSHGSLAAQSCGRKPAFLRWLRKLFKGRSNRQKLPQLHGEETIARHVPGEPMDDQSRAKNGESDHAVALSLAEDLKEPHGCRRRAEHDEDLARALQEKLNEPSYPSYDPTSLFPGEYRLCDGCNGDLGYGDYLLCMGAFWHPSCFRCYACGYQIVEHEGGILTICPVSESCIIPVVKFAIKMIRELIGLESLQIPPNDAGLIEFRSHPFWGQKYCPIHEHDNTARCCSCERLESLSARYIPLGDGRNLCLECMESAVMDTGDCQPLYHSIRDFYEGMNMKLDQQIPMLLVERQALNEATEWEKNGHRQMPETRGLCLSEEQTVTSIHRRPRLGGSRLIRMKTLVKKLSRKCEVTAILVLYGLPRLLTGSILAHELMHGWLRLKGIMISILLSREDMCKTVYPFYRVTDWKEFVIGYRNLSPEVEEGICQALSYMWLETEVLPCSMGSSAATTSSVPTSSSFKKGGKSDSEKKLGRFFIYQICNDTSTAYGKGFRDASASISKYGLRRTINHIQLTGNFPS